MLSPLWTACCGLLLVLWLGLHIPLPPLSVPLCFVMSSRVNQKREHPPLPDVHAHNVIAEYGDDAMVIRPAPNAKSNLPFWARFALMNTWLGTMHLSVIWVLASITFLVAPASTVYTRLLALAALAVFFTLSLTELGCFDEPIPRFGYVFTNFIDKMCCNWFPIEVILEGRKHWHDHGVGPRIVAYEPHSLLPLGFIAFVTESGLLPKNMAARWYVCGTSAIFRVPILKHLWGWSQTRAVSKGVMADIIKKGATAVVCPGGVAECMHMTDNGAAMVAFLNKRKGFVKLALEHDVPLCPSVGIGQTATLDFYIPGPPLFSHKAVEKFARFIGFVPLAFWGIMGCPVPHRRPMRIVVGRPVEVPPQQPGEDAASERRIEELHRRYVTALTELYDRHRELAVRELGCVAPKKLRIV